MCPIMTGGDLSTGHSAQVRDLELASAERGYVCQDNVRSGGDGVCVAPAAPWAHSERDSNIIECDATTP